MIHGTSHNAQLILRIPPRQVTVLRQAAKLSNKSLTDFILDSACQVAEKTVLNGKQAQAFVDLPDRPAQNNPGLKDLLSRPFPWCN
ncbi:hypothetical protein C4J95_2025 [Pseudomonas orientalis]|uniref:type II toxin-antitoxin system TacA family antitoxin n=1 Tax=Pseudomonas orientalis TaxID=76758 RepID=UPI000F56AEC7|nr:DUF1778 domain-containing protein [Pseudomonas orientalis]AZE99487.1 hypothetical protein C4J95_2025 [Pseudomonas orientalis]